MKFYKRKNSQIATFLGLMHINPWKNQMLTKRVKRYWTSNINKLIKRLLIDKIEPVYSILGRNDDLAANAGPADFAGAVDTTSPGMYQIRDCDWFILTIVKLSF